mmetsp:Transcript_2145/g.4941  ORF Transcript_2145/g.4941 Transcript_2145/m.4941 type:complete len:541 (-) Transcript_2145:113-1735(-)|eukprot:CAMPEP_0170577000 /NCGR_PEP_ID=MMETSP0224-20130122/4691_1 /TAXON_ID=285029 /ORGANISM="Togula jolla, Strain CCCM 725" /LENGTH=540 /DNA_ID=CAMNT_0010899877 /DNA_START=54 /DNA_END=1676 /DNA_ORIENTATION=-
MKVIITGGFGFLGQQLCKRILMTGKLIGKDDVEVPVTKVVLFDKAAGQSDLITDARVETVIGDIGDAATCRELVDQDGVLLFHLASIMSGQGELDFDLCMKVNMQGTLNLLEACRARPGARFIFASSGAAFGERPSGPETDTTKLLPYTTYGMTKAICELLINDYSRRGFVDGRTARLPTVIPRPEVNSGLPAAFSAIIREPLKGHDAVINVDPDMRHAVCGFRSLIRNLLHLAQLPEAVLATSNDRAMNMPCLSMTCKLLFEAVKGVVNDPSKLGSVTYKPDEAVMEKLRKFQSNMDSTRAEALGMVRDSSPGALAADFAAEYVDRAILKSTVEIEEEPRHNLILSNSSVRVFRTEFPAGESTLMHAHRVDSLYFFLNEVRTRVTKFAESPAEDFCAAGEVRYGTHLGTPLLHEIKVLGPNPTSCLDIELLYTSKAKGNGEPPAKKPRTAPLCDGLLLVKERPAARVYSLAVKGASSWKGSVPFERSVWIVRFGARSRGSFGDRFLRPGDTFYREGPEDMTLEVLGKHDLNFWITELVD